MPIEVIVLEDGCIAPANSDWVRLAPLSGGGWLLEGGIPNPPGVVSRYGEYPHAYEAERAAIDFARERGCGILYVEADARHPGA